MSQTVIPDELIAAYQATEYRACIDDESLILKIGQRSDELAHIFQFSDQSGATFITAENPFSQTVTSAENATNQRRLHDDLTALGATIFEGVGQGQDPNWAAEASFLAIGVSRAQARELGQKYRQNAIVWIDADTIPELILLR